MNPSSRSDLGRGVRLTLLADGSYAVHSERLPLPWTAPTGRAAGTAVVLEGEPFEVAALQRSSGSEVWTLRPWPDGEAMRTVVTLDREWVEALARELAWRRRANRARWWMIPLAPVLGSAPSSLQQQWASRWSFPAVTASLLSSLVELAVSGVGILHVLASAFGGGGILPPWLEWFALAAPVLAVEAVVRLKHVAALHEPIGSALLLPLAGLTQEAPPPVRPAPAVRRHDAEKGELELWSPIHRSDWLPDGTLPYRGQPHRLTSVEREGRGWIYTFARSDREAEGRDLRLLPPSGRRVGSARSPAPSVLRNTVGTALACLGPRDLQEAWGRRIGAPAVLLTVLGAGAECCGSLINLAAAGGSGASWLLPVNLYLLAEGAIRLALVVGTGRAVGSLPGMALRPALERLMSR